MLKYSQKFGNIKHRPIFATVLIQTRCINGHISIQKKLF